MTADLKEVSMLCKTAGIFAVVIVLLSGFIHAEGDSTREVDDTVIAETTDVKDAARVDHFVVTYFHGNRRCTTCKQLEEYSKEAIETGFEKQLADSTLIWRTINYDEDANAHFLEDYKLYTKALILSRVDNGAEQDWVNLAKIWELVGERDEYITYVQEETRKFVAGTPADE